jgi:hypothetical protein
MPPTSTKATRGLRVFLCHSRIDKEVVRDLYDRLISSGIHAWLDVEDLLAGQDWALEISRAVRSAEVVVVCLSKASTTKAGYVQKEIRFALDIADEQPEGTIFLIPVRLEECDVPNRLQRWHWVDLFSVGGYDQLMRSLRWRMERRINNNSSGSTYSIDELEFRIDHRADQRRDHRSDHRLLRS